LPAEEEEEEEEELNSPWILCLSALLEAKNFVAI